jgi:hypothetical protein
LRHATWTVALEALKGDPYYGVGHLKNGLSE